MSRINQLLTCGLLAASLTGCQTAKNVTGHVASWRPFGGETAPNAALAAEDAPASETELGDQQPLVAEAETKPTPDGASPKLPVAEIVPAGHATQTAAPATKPADNSFEEFIRSMEKEGSVPVTQADTPQAPPLEAQPTPQVAKSTPVDQPAVGDTKKVPAAGTEDLARQIESLLSDYQPKAKPVATVDTADAFPEQPAPSQSTSTQTAQTEKAPTEQTPTENKDPALVAFDLASFADAAGTKSVSKSKPSSSVPTVSAQDDFAAWMAQSQSAANSTTAPVTTASATAAPATAEYPWDQKPVAQQAAPTAKLLVTDSEATTAAPSAAAQPESHNNPFVAEHPWATGIVTAAQTQQKAIQPVSASRSDAPKLELTPSNSVTAPTSDTKLTRRPVVSADVMQMLEEALGSETWKKATVSVGQLNGQLSPESQKIADLMTNKSSQVRLRGIRLAFEQKPVEPGLVSCVEQLLDDKSLTVQAHAASALYHWDRATEKSIETLSNIVTSKEGQPAQLAAMYLGDMTSHREQIIPILQTALLSTQGLTSMHVCEALLKHDPQNLEAVARLTELIRHENVEVRWLSAHALGSVQGELKPYAVEALRSGLRDVDSQVRATSALSLGGLGSVSQVAVAELTFLSKHADAKVKDAAAIALECLKQ